MNNESLIMFKVIEIRDDGYIGVMMKGDSNLTFFLTQESGPKSPREGQGDVCMVSLPVIYRFYDSLYHMSHFK